MTSGIDDFERYVRLGIIKHPLNSCLRWQINHCAVKPTSNGVGKILCKPTAGKNGMGLQKIDGCIASVMGPVLAMDKQIRCGSSSQYAPMWG